MGEFIKQFVEEDWQAEYHPLQPVYLADPYNDKAVQLQKIAPMLLLKANEDKSFWSNIITGTEYGIDALTTLSGIGNVLKFRHLARAVQVAQSINKGKKVIWYYKASRVIKGAAGAVEITSGTVNALLKITSIKDEVFGAALSEYLFWLELLTLSGELTLAIKKGLQNSAKKLVHKENIKHLEQGLDNLINENKISKTDKLKALDELDEIAELERKLGDFVLHHGDEITENYIKKIVKQVKESTGLNNFDINLVDRNNEKYRKLFARWEKGGSHGFFKPTTSEFGIRLYKGLFGEGPQIYMFSGRTRNALGKINNISFTKYTTQHELFHVEMFVYLKNKTPNYVKYWREIPTYVHEQYVLNRLLKTKKWKHSDLLSDLKIINEYRSEIPNLNPITLKELEIWKFEIELEKIGIKII